VCIEDGCLLPLVLSKDGRGWKDRREARPGGEEPEGALLFIPKSRWDDPHPLFSQVEARSTAATGGLLFQVTPNLEE
jgi:hypothetical protein